MNKAFDHLKFECGNGMAGYVRQTYNMTTLIEDECVEWKVGIKSKSQVSGLIAQQEKLTGDLEQMNMVLA